MIETFKIITGIYDNEVTEGIFDLDPNTRTRGHSKKIKKKFCRINLRKFSFTNRIVDLWNTLPQSVIDAMAYAISAYHHLSCEFEPRSWRGVLDTTL
jgi:hypothetical protein